MQDMYVVRYVMATKDHVYKAYGPTIWKIVSFQGDAVWGVEVESGTLANVRKVGSYVGVSDGSGRHWYLKAFDTLGEAQAHAAEVAAQMAVEKAADDARYAKSLAAYEARKAAGRA